MAKFRKIVVRPDTYETPEGRADVTPERIRAWVQKFKAMKAAGIKIPVPWGHQKGANPVEPEEEEEYRKSRFNATYVDDLLLHPDGTLEMVAEDPPGLVTNPQTGDLEDPKNHTRIGEVSVAVCDWKDGKGRLWKDAIRHIALTPLPVDHGEPGFKPVGDDKPLPGEQRFSLSRAAGNVLEFSLGGFQMAHAQSGSNKAAQNKAMWAQTDDVDEHDRDKSGNSVYNRKRMKDDWHTEMATEDAAPTDRVPGDSEKPIINYENKKGSGDAAPLARLNDAPSVSVHPESHMVPQLLMSLKDAGVHLPDDTTHDNFCSRLHVALHAIKGREGPAVEQSQGPAVTAEEPKLEHSEMAEPEPEGEEEYREPGQEEHHEEMEAEGHEGPKGEYREGEGQQEATDREIRRRKEPVKEEPMPSLMMSLVRQNPALKVLYDKAEKDDREKRMARLAALKERGVPVYLVKELEARASEVQFSLSESGVIEPEIDREIRLLERSFPDRRKWIGKKQQFATNADVREVVSPYDENTAEAVNENANKMTTWTKRNQKLREKPSGNGKAE